MLSFEGKGRWVNEWMCGKWRMENGKWRVESVKLMSGWGKRMLNVEF